MYDNDLLFYLKLNLNIPLCIFSCYFRQFTMEKTIPRLHVKLRTVLALIILFFIFNISLN